MTTQPAPILEFPSMTVGVMGSAGGYIPKEVSSRMQQLGREVASRGFVLVTGACPGIPHEAAKGAKEMGGVVVGISPALNFEEHVCKYHSPTRCYDVIVYTGSGLMGREIENIRTCDVVVFAGGRSGSLGEFAIAYDEGKIVGILDGTGGISEHIETIVGMVNKKTASQIVRDADPGRLIDRLRAIYAEELLPHYRRVLDGHDPDGVLDE